MDLKPYEITILLQMYNGRIIAPNGYTNIKMVRSKINWKKISFYYKVKRSFDSVAQRLVKRRLLFDDGKSMAVLFLTNLGVSFVVGYVKENPNASRDLESIISGTK